MKFLQWFLFNLGLYGAVIGVHYIDGGDWVPAVVTGLALFNSISFLLRSRLLTDKPKLEEYKKAYKMQLWHYFEFVWIIPITLIGEYLLGLTMVIEFIMYCLLIVTIKTTEIELKESLS